MKTISSQESEIDGFAGRRENNEVGNNLSLFFLL